MEKNLTKKGAGSGIWKKFIQNPEGKKAPDPDPQHWFA
jgi:hypothetical protein